MNSVSLICSLSRIAQGFNWSDRRRRHRTDGQFSRIEAAMQRMEWSLLTKLASSQRGLIAAGQPAIHEIVFTEAKTQESPLPNGSK